MLRRCPDYREFKNITTGWQDGSALMHKCEYWSSSPQKLIQMPRECRGLPVIPASDGKDTRGSWLARLAVSVSSGFD